MEKTQNKTSDKGNNLVKLKPVKKDWEHDLDIREYIQACEEVLPGARSSLEGEQGQVLLLSLVLLSQ